MPGLYAIVYATNSKIIRRIIGCDGGLNGDEVGPTAISPHLLGNGESVLYVPAPTAGVHQYQDWANAVAAATGTMPPSPNCAVVDDTNTVVAVICADAALDISPLGTLIQCYSPQIGVGCSYNPATQLFSTAPFTIPANSRLNPTPLPVNVPAQVIPNPTAV